MRAKSATDRLAAGAPLRLALVALIVLAHHFFQENPVPRRTLRDHGRFIWAALAKGTELLGARLAVLTTLVGGSLLAYALIALDLSWPWDIVVGLVVLLTVFVLGACQLFSQAYSVAMRFAPTWERLQARADTRWAMYNAENGSTDDAVQG
jgi:hypothetical protein